jgi:hypothetical protein
MNNENNTQEQNRNPLVNNNNATSSVQSADALRQRMALAMLTPEQLAEAATTGAVRNLGTVSDQLPALGEPGSPYLEWAQIAADHEQLLVRPTPTDTTLAEMSQGIAEAEDDEQQPLFLARPWTTLDMGSMFIGDTWLDPIMMPTFPATYVTTVTGWNTDGSPILDTRARYSPHINTWEAVLMNPTSAMRNLQAAKRSAAREIIRYLQPGLAVTELSGRIRMSRRIARGTWYADREGLVLHEDDCLSHAWDSDGDVGGIVMSSACDGEYEVMKNPVTLPIMSLRRIEESDVKPEVWHLFSKHQYDLALASGEGRTPATEENIFRETHFNLPLGIITNALHTRVVRKTEGLPYRAAIQHLPDPDLYQALEGDMLKAVRKGHAINENVVDQFRLGYRLGGAWRAFLTNTSRVGDMADTDTKWVYERDLREHMERVVNLQNIEWETLRPRRRPATPRPGQPAPEMEGRWVMDDELIDRLMNLGMLQVVEMPHASDQPLCAITVHNKAGDAVGLTDIKRNQGVVDGISWTVLLLPVWSAEHGRLLHPIEWLKWRARMVVDDRGRLVSGVDTVIREQGSLVANNVYPTQWTTQIEQRGSDAYGYWFWHAPAIEDPHWGVKLGRIMAFIQDHCGRYGDVPPVVIIDGQPDLSPIARTMAWGTVVMDHGERQETWQGMYSNWVESRQNGVWVTPATKGDDRRVRKHAWAHENGLHPWWADTRSNPKRAAQIRSQLSRAIHKCTMRVAITLSRPLDVNPIELQDDERGTEFQTYITPSGISKQQVTTAFGRRITHTPPPDEELAVGKWTAVPYWTVTGELRMCWSAGPRQTADIGKLVDKHGQKTVPMALGLHAWTESRKQVMVEQTATAGRRRKSVVSRTPIDMLIPIHELMAKDLEWLLDDAKQEAVQLDDGREIVAWVTDMVFYRTGAATENMLVRTRNRWVKGIDAHMLVAAMHRRAYAWFKRNGTTTPEAMASALNSPHVPLSVKNALLAHVQVPNLEYARMLRTGIEQMEVGARMLAEKHEQQGSYVPYGAPQGAQPEDPDNPLEDY